MSTSLPRLAERVDARTTIDASGCWLWKGGTNGRGYGTLQVKSGGVRTIHYVHRVIYESRVAPIPDRYEIDHLCGVRNCVNPDHLEAVTHAENCARAASRIVSCPRGHAYDSANTYISREGKRVCRACRRDDKRAARATAERAR